MNVFEISAIIVLAVIYTWTFYNLPVLLAGIRKHRSRKKSESHRENDQGFEEDLPSFSIVVPAKNEEAVLPRMLEATLNQDYPREKVEVVIVEDGSTDGTPNLCKRFSKREQNRIKVVHGESSSGKPSALNRALKVSTGDIVAVFDADSIPERDMLRKAAKYFSDESVSALQGRTLVVNSEVNMLTKFVSYEESAWLEGYMSGKDALNLFVHLKGSCEFIRRKALEALGGWSEKHLSDDMEISARLTEKGYKIRYAPDVRSWQESPETLGQMLRQRIRWFRGSMEVALKYGRLLKRPSLKTLDAEMTLLGPFVLIISLFCYLLGPLAFSEMGGSLAFTLTSIGWISLTVTFVVGALALFYIARPKRKRDLLWLPFIYAYWMFQVVLATWALLRIVFRAPKEWKKTGKTGVVAVDRTDLPSHISNLTGQSEEVRIG